MKRTKSKPSERVAPKKALTGSANTFQGVKLFPLTKQREVVAAEMGLKFGFVFPYRSQFFLRDVMLLMWLCSIPAEEKKGSAWCVDRVEYESGAEATKEMYAFAKRKGIGVNTPAFNEGYRLVIAMMKEVRECKGEPVISEDREAETPPDSGEL